MSYTINNPVPVHQTEQELGECFGKWGVRDYHVDYNVQRARLRSLTLGKQERAVTVRWIPRGKRGEVVVSSDSQDSVAGNLRLLYLAIDAMRMNEKRGIGDTMRAAYLQLDAGSSHWTSVLALPPSASLEEVEAKYRALAKQAHSDLGGSDEDMAALNAAREQALREARP